MNDETRTRVSASQPPSDTDPATDANAAADTRTRAPAPAPGSEDFTRVRASDSAPPSGEAPGPSAQFGAVPGYEILGELGRGAMGVVYKARHTKLNRLVALKMALVARVDEKDLIRFLAEAEAVASVKHENVVQVYDYGDSAGRPYMALELCAGGSLADRLRRDDPLGPEDAPALVERICAGVSAGHEAGIVHRDLKPGNVLLSAGGVPKVADFGLAKRASSDLTATQAVMGTPAYMSPEQAGGKTKFVGPQADVWALGAILYESLTGGRPFVGPSTEELLAQVLQADPPAARTVRPGIPRDLDLICGKCLEKDPADRYATARELADDLERFARGQSVTARRSTALAQLGRWGRRNPVSAGLAVAVILALAAGGTVSGLLAYRASKAAQAAEARAQERDAAVRKQQQLVQEFMRFLTQDKKLSDDDRIRLAETFLASHTELSREEFADVFHRSPGFARQSQGGTQAGASFAPSMFGD